MNNFNSMKSAEEYAKKSDIRIKELEAELVKREWQPMVTAPRDGTEILGVSAEGIRCVVRWCKYNHIPLYGWVRQVELYGEEVDGFDPVKWMPLPEPPRKENVE